MLVTLLRYPVRRYNDWFQAGIAAFILSCIVISLTTPPEAEIQSLFGHSLSLETGLCERAKQCHLAPETKVNLDPEELECRIRFQLKHLNSSDVKSVPQLKSCQKWAPNATFYQSCYQILNKQIPPEFLGTELLTSHHFKLTPCFVIFKQHFLINPYAWEVHAQKPILYPRSVLCPNATERRTFAAPTSSRLHATELHLNGSLTEFETTLTGNDSYAVSFALRTLYGNNICGLLRSV